VAKEISMLQETFHNHESYIRASVEAYDAETQFITIKIGTITIPGHIEITEIDGVNFAIVTPNDEDRQNQPPLRLRLDIEQNIEVGKTYPHIPNKVT